MTLEPWDEDSELPFLLSKELRRELPKGALIGFGLRGLGEQSLVPRFVHKVLTLHQVHGDTIVVIQDPKELDHGQTEGDGWIIESEPFYRSGLAFAIRTADCLPVLFIGERFIALIHAGWRGLRQQILVRTLERFRFLGDFPRFVSLGPAADPLLYEVGDEFCQFFPESGALLRVGERLYFNMYSEALFQLQSGSYAGRVESSPVFTISDERLFSHRKEPEGRGRNYTVALFRPE